MQARPCPPSIKKPVSFKPPSRADTQVLKGRTHRSATDDRRIVGADLCVRPGCQDDRRIVGADLCVRPGCQDDRT
jgi:hypothetical protein